jgi:hypothetical protein
MSSIVARQVFAALSMDFEANTWYVMPIRITCHDKRRVAGNNLNSKGIAILCCAISRRIIRTGNSNSAYYADPYKHCWAEKGST